MHLTITPPADFPTVSRLAFIAAGSSLSPDGSVRWDCRYQLQKVVPVAAIPAVTETQVVPATDDAPETTTTVTITPEVPASEVVTVIQEGVNALTTDQWNGWEAGPSNDVHYVINCVAENLGLTVVE
jgi:hypothetical protein